MNTRVTLVLFVLSLHHLTVSSPLLYDIHCHCTPSIPYTCAGGQHTPSHQLTGYFVSSGEPPHRIPFGQGYMHPTRAS